jgi:hypothetical protein
MNVKVLLNTHTISDESLSISPLGLTSNKINPCSLCISPPDFEACQAICTGRGFGAEAIFPADIHIKCCNSLHDMIYPLQQKEDWDSQIMIFDMRH